MFIRPISEQLSTLLRAKLSWGRKTEALLCDSNNPDAARREAEARRHYETLLRQVQKVPDEGPEPLGRNQRFSFPSTSRRVTGGRLRVLSG